MIELKKKRQFFIFSHDLCMVAIAWIGAFLLRLNPSNIPTVFIRAIIITLPIVLIVQGISNYLFGVHRGSWQYVSLNDLVRITKSAVLVFILIVLSLFFLGNELHIPRSVPFIYIFLLIVLSASARLLYRKIYESARGNIADKRILIIGAGSAGESLARELLRSKSPDYCPVAFIDDSEDKIGRIIHGLPICGSLSELNKFVVKFDVNLLIIAIPSLSAKEARRVVELCEATGIPFRTVPSLNDLTSGRVSLNSLRQVALEDLLGREPVSLDKLAIVNSLKNKTILVTGGAGSIGSELCRQIVQFSPKHLIISDSNEFNLYQIDLEFKALNIEDYTPLLLDVTDKEGVKQIFDKYKPQVVFHAAAYKHVPLLESQIRCALRNNVLGTWVIAEQAVTSGVDKFVLVSTDKAVNPTNIMGATKRIAEIICQNYNEISQTQFVTVRFGNVLGSAGSVVPLFKKQLEKGGPITVTHPDITRYFMTIPEASLLILQSEALGQGGEIFVLDMGEPIKIQYLAEQIIRLADKKVGDDIEITYTGLRPGEKLYEELFHDRENLLETLHPKILLAKAKKIEWDYIIQHINLIESACYKNNIVQLKNALHALVPEYKNELNTLQ